VGPEEPFQVGEQPVLLACQRLSSAQQRRRLVGCAPENRLDLDAASGAARHPLGRDGAGLDEELGADGGQGKCASPQSTSSPRVESGCLAVRRMRPSRIPGFNEISSLTLRALR
jgi:hypothetical protein